eukprot:2939960-Amphidinium_carterae.1
MSLGTAQLLDTRALTKPPRLSGNDEDYENSVTDSPTLPAIDALEDTIATQSRNLYFLLIHLCQTVDIARFQEQLVGVLGATSPEDYGLMPSLTGTAKAGHGESLCDISSVFLYADVPKEQQ